jgi:hypothetical protein
MAAMMNLNNTRDYKATTNHSYRPLVRYFSMVTIHN